MIAALDGAYTKYYEATLESEWRGEKTFVRGSYTWSDYYGNFDQDNTTGLNNDMNTFIGSSNIADGAGRQLWDMKDGELRGDRPHLLKLYGSRELGWKRHRGRVLRVPVRPAVGGQSYEPYRSLTTSTSDSNRNAEPAGSRRTDSHWQMDLNYTQNFRLAEPAHGAARRPTCSTSSTSRPATTSRPGPQLAVRHAAELLRPAAAADRGQDPAF